MAHKFGHYVFVSMLDMLPPQWRDPMQWVFVCAASFVRAISCFMRYAGSSASLSAWVRALSVSLGCKQI